MSAPPRNSPGLPPAGHAYVGAIIALGGVLLGRCALLIVREGVPSLWFVFAALTILSGSLRVKVPSLTASLSASEMFAFTGVLLFGPAEGAVILAADGLIHSIRRRNTWQQVLFNCANLGISAWLSGTVFFASAGTGPLITERVSLGPLILPLGLLTLTYFVVNSGLTAAAVAFEARLQPFALWREHFLWMCPTYFAGASVALLLVVALRQIELSALALLPPLLFISYLTLRSTLGRVEDARSHLASVNRLYLSTVETLASAIDAKDEVTHGHIRRVQNAAVGLARELRVADELALKAIEAAALLHDTGKLAVPDHILNKPGKLTPAEYEKMKLHAPIGAAILSTIDFPYPVVPIVRHHHENWDGSGYPDGLRGEAIPIGARILSVVDCYDALTSDRPYRRRMSHEQASAILLERRGTMYDPIVVDAFLRAHDRLMPQVDAGPDPVAMAIRQARATEAVVDEPVYAARPEGRMPEEALALDSLARAMSGGATVADVGALVWMMMRQIVPCDALCIFIADDRDSVCAQYAAGLHAAALRGSVKPIGGGVAGWVAANRRTARNADPVLDFGPLPPDVVFKGSLAVPLVHHSNVVAVLTLYSAAQPYAEDAERLVTMVAPHLASVMASVPTRAAEPWTTSAERSPANDARAKRLRIVRESA
jgi:putative nucleotidyltransferase with HDIG domain